MECLLLFLAAWPRSWPTSWPHVCGRSCGPWCRPKDVTGILILGCGRSPRRHSGQGSSPDATQRRSRPPRSRPHTSVFTAHGHCQPPCSALSHGTRWAGPKAKAKRRTGPALKTLRALAVVRNLVRQRSRARLATYSLASLSRPAGRQSVALRAQEKHQISRAWERSFPSRSLGLAPASLATASVSAGALPSSCAASGRLIAFSGPVGACANFAKPAKFLQHSLLFARVLSALRHGAGCVRSPEFSPWVSALVLGAECVQFQQCSISKQISSRS